MIIVAGIPSERPLKWVIDELGDLNSEYMLFNQREFQSIELNFSIENGSLAGILKIKETQYDLADVSGVYVRLMDENSLPEIENEPVDSAKRIKCRKVHQALIDFCEICPGKIVNRHSAMTSNSSKPYQTQLIRKYGLLIPDTLITNEPKKVLEFNQLHKKIIYKSISSVRSIVQIFKETDKQNLNRILHCPVQFQQFVEGTNVRVHVIGERIFATSIETETVDYRYASKYKAKSKLRPYDLDSNTKEKCIKLTKGLGLDFSGIDLKICKDNQIFCFEVNPSPAYSFYEANANQPISKAVAEYLSTSNNNGRKT